MTTTLPQIPTTLPANITGKFNIALTNSKFQELSNEAATLVFNEDNLETIKAFIDKTKKLEKSIENVHKDGKAEALEIGRNWDKAKQSFLAQKDAISEIPKREYDRICREIAQRQADELKEKQRVDNIKSGIETNAIDFAKRIADCNSSEQLTRIESIINLEKGRKEKYQEFLPEAAERFSQLNTILSDQKKIIRSKEQLEKEKQEALAKGDEEKIIEIEEKQEVVSQQIEEKKVEVQEKAIEQSMASSGFSNFTTVYPAVKARRTTWKFEMVNEKEVMKKNPELLIVSLNDDLVKTVLQTLKDTGALKDKTELVLNGIKFYEEKTY